MSLSGKHIVFTTGGTGGHIFPAIAVADECLNRYPDCDIKFVGSADRMEMRHVPNAGYSILGLPVKGFKREKGFRQWAALKSLWLSISKVRRFFRSFRPDLVLGFGAFASAPVLIVAAWQKIPMVLHEQNAYPGLVNRVMGRFAKKVFVAYDGMEKYFDPGKIKKVGNPVRHSDQSRKSQDSIMNDLREDLPMVLITGGSQGAKSLNQAVISSWSFLLNNTDIQWVWQCGSLYIKDLKEAIDQVPSHIKLVDFIADMPAAMRRADLVCARAGALTLAELAFHEKAAILVPSPNVAEDHQTKNALAMVEKKAAVMIKDAEVQDQLIPKAVALLEDKKELDKLKTNIAPFASPKAAQTMIDDLEKMWSKV